MGTDSKYLEEAMAELERSFGTFSDNMELTSLIVNNLENRLDNVCVDKTYADIQGGHLEVFSLFNRELAGDVFNGYYVKKYDGEKFVYQKVGLDLLFKKISILEKDFEKDEYLYGSIIGYSYIRYYKHHTIAYRLDLGVINEYSEENYVSNEITRDVKGKIVTSSGNYIADSLRKNKVTAKDIETGKKVFKYVVTYRSKPFYCEETGNNIYLETGCYKWVEE